MKTVIVFLLIAGFFAPPSAISATKRLAIENFSLPSNSKLNSNIVTEDFKQMVEKYPGRYRIEPDLNVADFVLKASMMIEENGQFTIQAIIYKNVLLSKEFAVKQFGNTPDQALSCLWSAIKSYPKDPEDTTCARTIEIGRRWEGINPRVGKVIFEKINQNTWKETIIYTNPDAHPKSEYLFNEIKQDGYNVYLANGDSNRMDVARDLQVRLGKEGMQCRSVSTQHPDWQMCPDLTSDWVK